MRSRVPGDLAKALALTVLLLASWACLRTSGTTDAVTPPAPTSTSASTGPQATPAVPSTPLAQCQPPATEIELGAPISSEIVGVDQPPQERKFFCVNIPDGVSSIRFELADMTSDLDLFVGHPDLETVQNGGIWFWYSENPDLEDEAVLVEPVRADHVIPGAYYIEVSAKSFRDSSPFTLTVQLP